MPSDLYFASLTVLFFSMPKSSRSAGPDRRSSCPIAGALDVLGDRWTLLVIRDLFAGKSRYGEFAASAEGIPTNILADRLVKLEEAGLITRKAYQDNPPRHAYALTPKGNALRPVLGSLAMWAARFVPKTEINPALAAVLRG
jgi:DNA-binding HxlR family transcriptional regulator